MTGDAEHRFHDGFTRSIVILGEKVVTFDNGILGACGDCEVRAGLNFIRIATSLSLHPTKYRRGAGFAQLCFLDLETKLS